MNDSERLNLLVVMHVMQELKTNPATDTVYMPDNKHILWETTLMGTWKISLERIEK